MSAQVSAAHAARMYGRSEKTVRRWIAAGKLPAEKVDGSYLVDLADVAQLVGEVSVPTSAQVSAHGTDTMSAQSADSDVRTAEEDVRPSALAQAEAISMLVQPPVAAVLGPLVAELAASRQTNERQAEQLVSQAETIGTLRAELAAEKAAHSPVAADLTPDPAPLTVESPGTRLRRLPPWLLLATIMLLALVVGWPR